MEDITRILERAVAALKGVPGVLAIVLGGSRARGTHAPGSDIDIGIYYGGEPRLSIAGLEEAARRLDDERRENLIAPPGAWGEWVDGGGWLVVGGLHVDLILRNLGRVRAVVRECREGIVTSHYQTGHPHAYISAMYMGELAVCRLLWEASGEVSRLKAEAAVYPAALRAALLRFFSFEAGFSQQLAAHSARGDDAYYVTAHLVRAVSCLNQVLFALNGQYCLNEKRAVRMIETFARKPRAYKRRVDEIFSASGTKLPEACDRLMSLVDEVKRLIQDEGADAAPSPPSPAPAPR